VLPLMEIKSFITGRRGVCLPFSDYCEPIIPGGVQFEEMLEFVTTYGRERGWKYIEIRGGQAFLKGQTPSDCYFGHTLDLEKGPEAIFSGFRESNKRNIRKAEREGVEVAILDSLDAVREFFRLNCITREHHGLPPQPFRLFRNIHEYVISKGSGFVALASYRGENIASAVFFHFGKKALYKYGASNLDYQHLRANNLVMWEGIKWYSTHGYESLSFGRTEPQNDGLRQFKKGWGAGEYSIKYYRYDLPQGAFVENQSTLDGRYSKLIRTMPGPMLKAIGALLYRHVG